MARPVLSANSDLSFDEQEKLFDPFKVLINVAAQGDIKSAKDLAQRAAQVAPAPSADFVPPPRPDPILPGQALQNLFSSFPQIDPGMLRVPFNLQGISNLGIPGARNIAVPPPQPPRPSPQLQLRRANPGAAGTQQGPVPNSLGNIIQGVTPQQLSANLPFIQALFQRVGPGAGSLQQSLGDTLGGLIARRAIQ